MKINVGGLDRLVRAAVGTALLAWGIQNLNWIGFLGLIPLLTAAVSYCPLYQLLGIKTNCSCGCNRSEKKA